MRSDELAKEGGLVNDGSVEIFYFRIPEGVFVKKHSPCLSFCHIVRLGWEPCSFGRM